MSFLKERLSSFLPAFNGVLLVMKGERNAWIHLFFTIFAIGLSIFLRITLSELAIIVFVIGFVWAAECFNTAIEAVVDICSPDYHELAKKSKDASAAAVLIAALASVVVGILILGPPLFDFIQQFFLFI